MLDVLEANDRTGEQNIAIFQACGGLLVLLVNIMFWVLGDWSNLNLLAMIIACTALLACFFRYRLAQSEILNNVMLHILSVVDGFLIFMMIVSQSVAFNMPVETAFTSPAIVFLMVYAGIRIVRFDPVPIFIAGFVVIAGWCALLLFAIYRNLEIANSYHQAVFSSKIFPVGQLEMTAGFVLFVAALAFAAKSARKLLSKSAHYEDLEEANARTSQYTEQLQSILSNSPDGIVICDDNGKIIEHNSAFSRMLEYENRQLVNIDVSTLINKEKVKEIILYTKQMQGTDGKSEFKGRTLATVAKTRSGDKIPVEISMSVFPRENQQCFAIFVRNITDRQEKEHNERRALSRFEKVVNSAMDAIIIIDEHNKVLNFNPAAEEIFGYKSEEAVGEDLGQLIIPSRLRAAHNRGLKHYHETGVGPVLNQRYEVPAKTASGEEIEIELTIRELDSAQGKMFIGYARDVSEKNRVQQELVKAKEEAEEANKTKSRFLAMMSHEIRTPLNGVLGMMSVMESRLEKEDDKRLIRSATKSGESLMTILNDILDLSKLESGKFDISPHDFHVDSLLDNVMSLVKQKAQEKGLELTCTVDNSVPKVLLGDSDRIRQVLLNLVWNALKFTENGSITIEAKPGRNGSTIFSVSDTGMGISESEQSKLFQEFSVLNTSYSDKLGGTGLGLAISRALVASMEGRIWLFSEPGKGSKFQFELPLSVGNENNIIHPKGNEIEILAMVPKGLRILVAEDNRTNQMVIGHLLKNMGCEPVFAVNGLEAVEAVKNDTFDAVLMDISMPEMDGFEATKNIRALKNRSKANLPIIALTAYAMKADREKTVEAGMNYFIPKPVSRMELAHTLSELGAKKHVKPTYISGVSSETPIISGVSSQTPIANGDVPVGAFDMAVLDDLLNTMGENERDTILNHMEADLIKFCEGLQKAHDDKDLKLADGMTHGLKGVSGMFGAIALSKDASELNDEIRFQEEKGLTEMDETIQGQLSALIDFTRSHVTYLPKIKDEYLNNLYVENVL